jgi:metallo-beta-lactamase class B
MRKYFATVLCTALLSTNAIPGVARAQGSMAAAQPHLDKARAAAYRPGFDLTNLYETVCKPAMDAKGPTIPDPSEGGQTSPTLANRKIPPRSEWYSDPAKVFDNLYWLGSFGDNRSVPQISGDSTWAVTTSAGIILVDSGMDYSAKTLITDGLKKMGQDPTQIKYVILSHVHGDRYFGSKYLQDTYHPHIVMSEADWNVMEKSNEPNELKPTKDMIATDGMRLTLGDTTLRLYLTPGHTPGTISTIIPLKDGSEKHVGVVWGGINPSYTRYGVQYYPSLQETFKTWSASITRFQKIADAAGADTYLTIHPFYDNALEKIHEVQYRMPGQPNPMVSKDNLSRWFTILRECTDAQLARIGPA